MTETPTDTSIPAHPTAEAALLAAYLHAPTDAECYASTITLEHFHDPLHQAIWQAVTDLAADGNDADPILIGDKVCIAHPVYTDRIYVYLGELLTQERPTPSIPAYLDILTRFRTARALRAVGHYTAALATNAATADTDGMKLLVAEAQERAFTLADSAGTHDTVERISTSVEDLLPRLDPQSADEDERFATGLADLDRALGGGFHPGELIIIGARPGVGKSTLALDILRHNAIRENVPCAMFSLEMSHMDCAYRVVSAEGRLSLRHLRAGKVTDAADWGRISDVVERIGQAPLYIDTPPAATLAYLRAHARYLVNRFGVRIVVVDYLQLAEGSHARLDRQSAVAEISRGLKQLARELNIVVIAVSQLNRGPEQRQDKRPQVSDLRETGQIEQDADGILLLYRQDSFDPDTAHVGESEVIIAKYRHGPLATVTVAFQGSFSRHISLAPEPPY